MGNYKSFHDSSKNGGITDIGRKSVSKWGFLTLGTGLMDARFHCGGAVEVAMERLKSWATGL